MRPTLAVSIVLLACAALAAAFHPDAEAQTVGLEHYFKTLKRPASPNTWLVAPADFAVKPDAVAPVFDVPVSRLRETFKSVVAATEGAAVVAEASDGIHLVVTTSLLKFQDDVRALFIPVDEGKSTIALYSASRVGWWDFGTNRRRVESWLEQTRAALARGKR